MSRRTQLQEKELREPRLKGKKKTFQDKFNMEHSRIAEKVSNHSQNSLTGGKGKKGVAFKWAGRKRGIWAG